MKKGLRNIVLLVVLVGAPKLAAGQAVNADSVAIDHVIDRYGALLDSMDADSLGQLMTADRVWIGQGTGRQVGQAKNADILRARFGQAQTDAPGAKTFTEDRDRLIRFYGDGSAAVASFYRYTTVVAPDSLSDVPESLQRAPSAVTLVLEKRDGEWKIVHIHMSDLGSGEN